MNRVGPWVGLVLLLACGWWVSARIDDLLVVSPVHWPLLLPRLVLEAVPVAAGLGAAAALLVSHRRAPAWLLIFTVTLSHAAAVSFVAPEIDSLYETTLRQSHPES